MGKRGPGAKPARAPRTAPEAPVIRLKRGATRADRLIAWCETLTVTSGAHAGKPLRLRPWQRDIIRGLYETDAAGRRLVRTAVVSMGRKNGKTGLAGALALAHLCGPEAVPRGQVVSAAADRGQASLVYAELRAFALAQPHLAERLIFRDFNRTVEDVDTGSTFAALSADARKAHGLSPTFAIADEVAQWRGRDLYDALATGAGAHAEALLLAISTRSPDPDNPLEELLRYGDGVADGTIPDPTFRSFVWTTPRDADPWAEETWKAANPALGDFRSLEDVRSQAAQARHLPSKEASFRAFTLNQPVTPDERFIGPADWDACSGMAEAKGPCVGGLDLASGAADLTAFSLYWPETGLLRSWAFLPGQVLADKEREDRAPYSLWRGQGHVIEIPGRAIDRPWLLTWIAQQVEGLDLTAIACDRWGLADLQAVQDREGLYLPLKPIGMGYKDASPALTAFEAVVLQGFLHHGGNPLLRWSLANAAVDMDPAGGRKLNKDRSTGRIDPLVSSVIAVGLASREPAAPTFEGLGWVAV